MTQEAKQNNYVSIAHLRQTLDDINSAIAQCKKEYEDILSALNKQRDSADREYRLAVDENIDITKIREAEDVLYIRGNIGVLKSARSDSPHSIGRGDDISAVNQAIQWFACSYKPTHYNDLNNVFFGCKNYDRWTHQREDCEYGYGPRHGSIVFAIGLRPEWRNKGLTERQRSCCIYYLEALKAGKLLKKEEVSE